MDLALTLVAIAAVVILVARACEPLGLASPLALLGVGVVASYLPGLPEISMSPEVVLFGLLPPLPYAAAVNTSLIDLRRMLTPILGLSVGLVLFTALGVAVVAHWLLPISFAGPLRSARSLLRRCRRRHFGRPTDRAAAPDHHRPRRRVAAQ